MAKDDRLYAKFTLDFPDHPKIAPLSDAAYRALTEMTIYSRRMLTDGFISKRLVGSKGEAGAKWSLQVVSELCANDDEHPSLIEEANGYLLHDFAQHQTTKDDLESRRAVREAAGRRGGIASGKARRSKGEANASQSVERNAKQNEHRDRDRDREKTMETYVGNSSIEAPPKKTATPATRGTRLPPDWVPPPDVIAQMRDDHPHVDLKAEHAKFVDYWRGVPSARGCKADWVATWRNWIRRAAEQQHPRTNGGHVSTVDNKAIGWQELKGSR